MTAKHCINGYNTFNLKPTEKSFNLIGLRYYNPKDKKFKTAKMDIEKFKRYLPNDYFFKDADVAVFSYRDTVIEPYLKSIESYYRDDDKEDQIIKQSIVWGYGQKKDNQFTINSNPILYKGYFPEKPTADPYYPLNEDIYYTMQPKSIQGMSGSPVFIEYHTLHNKKQRIAFGGVIFGTDTIYNLAYVVHSFVVKEKINHF